MIRGDSRYLQCIESGGRLLLILRHLRPAIAERRGALEGDQRAVREGNREGNNAALDGLLALVIMTGAKHKLRPVGQHFRSGP